MFEHGVSIVTDLQFKRNNDNLYEIILKTRKKVVHKNVSQL